MFIDTQTDKQTHNAFYLRRSIGFADRSTNNQIVITSIPPYHFQNQRHFLFEKWYLKWQNSPKCQIRLKSSLGASWQLPFKIELDVWISKAAELLTTNYEVVIPTRRDAGRWGDWMNPPTLNMHSTSPRSSTRAVCWSPINCQPACTGVPVCRYLHNPARLNRCKELLSITVASNPTYVAKDLLCITKDSVRIRN